MKQNKVTFQSRLKNFRNGEILPEAYVEEYGRDIRLHVLDPNTVAIKGTLGANSKKIKLSKGYHLFNTETKFDAFFENDGMRFRTGMKASEIQEVDLIHNGNLL